MKNSKFIITILLAVIIEITSIFCVSAASSTIDEAVLSGANEDYVPLYTTSPDSSLKDYSSTGIFGEDYQLFYTQTTFLALIAGFLIIFKVRCFKGSEKMHRSKKK